MEKLVEYIVKSLVIDSDNVQVSITEDENEKVIHVMVNPDDMGRIIGKGGKIASSIRTIVKSLSAKEDKKVFVKFGE
jgi:hypothetical protein